MLALLVCIFELHILLMFGTIIWMGGDGSVAVAMVVGEWQSVGHGCWERCQYFTIPRKGRTASHIE